MKNFVKINIFIVLVLLIYMTLSYIFVPKYNLKRYGIYKTSKYLVLGEKPNTIDVAVMGDSLVYSSLSPMEIYGKYGYTIFNCSRPMQTVEDSYKYYKATVETQNIKVAIIEGSMFIRSKNKTPWQQRHTEKLKDVLPLLNYHDRWKRILKKDISTKVNIYKGYVKNLDINPGNRINHMEDNPDYSVKIPDSNLKYMKKIVDLSKENDIKLIMVGFPSQYSWTEPHHRAIKDLAEEYNLTYINLNLGDSIDLDWEKDTGDKGVHVNYYGAKKVSDYIGNYLKEMNILENHKNDPYYHEWDEAYEYYSKN